MRDWRFWAGVAFFVVFVVYCRSVTLQTEKIESNRQRGILRLIFLGIPFAVLIVLLVIFWRELAMYVRYINR